MIETITMSDRIAINASEYLDPQRDVIDAAVRLANAGITHVKAGAAVLISFVSLRGVSSTFFNALFATLLNELGREQFDVFLDFEFGNKVQEQVAQRSLDTILGENP